jgi:hypothetical protein
MDQLAAQLPVLQVSGIIMANIITTLINHVTVPWFETCSKSYEDNCYY